MGEIQKRKCPYCGNMTPVGGEYCAACNSFLGNDPTQKETAQYAQPKEEQSAQPVAQASYEEHDEFFSPSQKTCLACGRQINANATYCPICGNLADRHPTQSAQPTQSAPAKTSNQPWETFALLGFILSFFEPVVALVFCILARKHDISPNRRGMATAGLVISIVSLALVFLIYFIYYLTAIGTAFALY